MFVRSLCSYWCAAVIGVGWMPLGHAQSKGSEQVFPITQITERQLDLFASADIKSAKRSVDVPASLPMANWHVLVSTPQFYYIQAGPQAAGWARRKFITVNPGSGVVPTCQATASLPTQPTATTAGMAARPC